MLFLHGYLSDKRCFYNQIKFFSKYYDCYALDFTGFGDNEFMPFAYSLSDYADEVMAFVKANNLVKPIVVAHSFGARVAVKILGERYRESRPFSKLIITGGAGLKPKFSLKKSVKRIVYKSLRPILSDKQKQRFFSSDYRSLNPVMKESFKKIISEHLDDVSKNIDVPTLILYGKQDRETPPYMAEKFHKYISGSKLEYIEGAGHFAFLDKPYLFNSKILDFLSD